MLGMSIKENLREALTEAMKSGQDLRKTTLRMALAAIKNAEVEARGELEDDLVLNLFPRTQQRRTDSFYGRADGSGRRSSL